MGYININNLYKDQTILMFKECYALEKIHGISAHISFAYAQDGNVLISYFSGGEKHERFKSLFNEEDLKVRFVKTFAQPFTHTVVVYGEAYGGKQQGMSATYGKDLKFVAFDVRVGERWLSVPDAHSVCDVLGFDFVHYNRVSTNIAKLDAERDHHSIQAVRNGVTLVEGDPSSEKGYKIVNPQIREGVVLRPLIEMTLNNGARIIAKHKRDEFRETATPRVIDDPAKLKVLTLRRLLMNGLLPND